MSENDQSWAAFQEALGRRDIPKIASMIEFPLKGSEEIGSRKTFDHDFRILFPDEAVPTLLKFSPSADEIRSGTWWVEHNERHWDSDTDSSMFYQFVQTSDGKVRLKRIVIAG